MSETLNAPTAALSAGEVIAKRIAARAVQALADSLPDEDTIEAQYRLKGTPQESMFVVSAEALEELIAVAISNALYDGELAPNAPTAAERRYPEIPDGRMCESCGSLRYHATFCEKAPPMIRAGIRHHFDLLDIQLRQLGVVDDPDLRRYRDELGKAVGLVSQLYDSALLAGRQGEETMRSAAQGALDTWLQHAEMAEEWSAIETLRAALAATPEEKASARLDAIGKAIEDAAATQEPR